MQGLSLMAADYSDRPTCYMPIHSDSNIFIAYTNLLRAHGLIPAGYGMRRGRPSPSPTIAPKKTRMKLLKTTFPALLPLLAAAALSACGGSASTTTVTLGGTVTGLSSGTVTLTNGTATLTLAAGTTGFTFPSAIGVSSVYNVVVHTQPADLSCRVTNGYGVAGTSNITNLVVSCAPNHNLGGSITGLSTNGLVLANGSDTVSAPANATSFVFPNKTGEGFSYGVTVLTQPQGLTCQILNGTGVMGTTDTASVQVVCS